MGVMYDGLVFDNPKIWSYKYQSERNEFEKLIDQTVDIYDIYLKKWKWKYKASKYQKYAPTWHEFADIIKTPGLKRQEMRTEGHYQNGQWQWDIWYLEYPDVPFFLENKLTEEQLALIYRIRRENINLKCR